MLIFPGRQRSCSSPVERVPLSTKPQLNRRQMRAIAQSLILTLSAEMTQCLHSFQVLAIVHIRLTQSRYILHHHTSSTLGLACDARSGHFSSIRLDTLSTALLQPLRFSTMPSTRTDLSKTDITLSVIPVTFHQHNRFILTYPRIMERRTPLLPIYSSNFLMSCEVKNSNLTHYLATMTTYAKVMCSMYTGTFGCTVTLR